MIDKYKMINENSYGYRKLSLLVFTIFISLSFLLLIPKVVSATDPVFLNVSSNQEFVVAQNSTFFMYVLGDDADSHYPLNFSDTAGSDSVKFYVFSMENYNDTAAKINFTPQNDDVGRWNFHLLMYDTNSESDAVFVHFNVTNINDPPYLVETTPVNQSPLTRENAVLEFNVSAWDIDIQYNDSLDFNWTIDGIVNETLLNSTLYNSTFSMANYTPDFFSAGTHNITVNVTDEDDVWVAYSWNVTVDNENRVPVNNVTINNITMLEDTTNYSVINLSDYFYDLDLDDLPLSYDVVGDDNVTIIINASDPFNVTLIPDPDFYGLDIIQFRCYDGYNYTLSNEVALNVTNFPDPPEIVQVSNKTAFVGVQFDLQIEASDPDNDVLTYYDNTSLFNINSGTGFISFTAGPSDIGVYAIEINVSDGYQNASMVFNLSVINNALPIIGGKPLDNKTFTEDQTVHINFNATDGDAGDLLYFWSTSNRTSGSDDFNVTTTSSDPSLATSYIDFEPDQEDVGQWEITIWVNDSKGAVDSATFVLNITDVQYNPILLPDPIPPQRMKINLSFSYDVTATDADENLDLFGDNTSLFDISTSPSGDAISKTGHISFTPTDSDFGEHWVNITINDSTSRYDWQVVLFNVTYNAAPVLELIPNQTAREDELFQLQVNASDDDPQDTLIWYDNTSMFNISQTGMISFTPNISHSGNHSINITVSDGTVNVSRIFNMTISDVNDFPFWNPYLSEYWVNETNYYNTTIWTTSMFDNATYNRTLWNSSVYQNNLTLIYMDAYDEESSTLSFGLSYINFTNVSNDTIYSGIPNFINFTAYDGNTALLNMTPNNSVVGTYYLNFSVADNIAEGDVQTNWSVIKLTVYNVNDAPVISNFSPNITYYVNMTENDTMWFNVSAYELDYMDNITYQWMLNGTNISGANTSNYSYYADFLSAGWRNLSIVIKDFYNATTMLNWTINVSNLNRVGRFGQIIQENYTDFNSGMTQTNISIDSAGLFVLAGQSGVFESVVLDAKEDNLFHKFSIIQWQGNLTAPVDTSFDYYFQTRTANSVSGNCPSSITDAYNSSLTYDSTNSTILSTSRRCIQYRMVMDTNSSSFNPNITRVVINYIVANYSIEQNSNRTWIYVTDYFYDPDTDDNVTYNMSMTDNSSISEFNYSISGDRIYLSTAESAVPGKYDVVIHMDDGKGGIVDSNVMEIEVIETENVQQPIILPMGGGGGGSVNVPIEITVEKEVPKPVSFRLITPLNITTYDNDTIEVPINLVNNGNFTLQDLTLKVETPNSNVKLELSRESFGVIKPKQIEFAMLKISSYRTYGDYSVRITATSEDPPYVDTADIFVNSLLKATIDIEAVNTKVAFASDLLSSNQECLELNEFLLKARELVSEGDSTRASRLLDQIVEQCKYLVSAEYESPVEELPSKIYGVPRESAFILISVSIITLIVALALAFGWAHLRSKRRQNMKY